MPGDLTYQRSRNESVVGARREKHRIDFWCKIGICVSNLQFVFEVSGGAEATDDHARLYVTRIIHTQPGKRNNLHVFEWAADTRQQLQPLLDGKQGHTRGVHADPDYQMLEQARRTLDQIQMTVGWGIEAPCIHRGEF